MTSDSGDELTPFGNPSTETETLPLLPFLVTRTSISPWPAGINTTLSNSASSMTFGSSVGTGTSTTGGGGGGSLHPAIRTKTSKRLLTAIPVPHLPAIRRNSPTMIVPSRTSSVLQPDSCTPEIRVKDISPRKPS